MILQWRRLLRSRPTTHWVMNHLSSLLIFHHRLERNWNVHMLHAQELPVSKRSCILGFHQLTGVPFFIDWAVSRCSLFLLRHHHILFIKWAKVPLIEDKEREKELSLLI